MRNPEQALISGKIGLPWIPHWHVQIVTAACLSVPHSRFLRIPHYAYKRLFPDSRGFELRNTGGLILP